ncbi:MAG: Holliday junction branch migration protein RuvA, partial [Vulcanococcus sp.]
MIGWLQGQLADRWQQASRHGVLLVVAGVGYELLLAKRHWERLPAGSPELTLHVHQVIREDSWTLYGFDSRANRDLFRELVAVSGVGPQMALGLLGQLSAEELVRAIVQADLRLLCQAPGVGKRTAERLSVELRTRLQERFGASLAL